ncbi:MAG: hypothetical protein M3Y33_03670 [Actinomycetota bacterium]|nr:hypothetical protein [Actinomycetota bacterium]
MSTTSIGGHELAVRKLEELADDLGGKGFATTLVTGGGYPALTVVHRRSSRMTETIYAAPADGSWWLWWSWAERIAPVDETADAAGKIAHVLTAP